MYTSPIIRIVKVKFLNSKITIIFWNITIKFEKIFGYIFNVGDIWSNA